MEKSISSDVIKEEAQEKPWPSCWYDEMRQDPNNLSFWFMKLSGLTELKLPKTAIVQVPDDIIDCFWCYEGPKRTTFQDEVYAWVKEAVMPEIKEMGFGLIFLKNGGFSNKFDARCCMPGKDALSIASAILGINYQALCFEAGGVTEVVIRERIGWDNRAAYRIYNGLPLVPEIRVFYDFDAHKVLYAANYWDREKCEEAICRNPTNALAYRAAMPGIEEFFEEHKDEVCALAEKELANVDLPGKWSVDLMWDAGSREWWLIDMALANQSAYWDPRKAGL